MCTYIVSHRSVTAATVSSYLSSLSRHLSLNFGLSYPRHPLLSAFLQRFSSFPVPHRTTVLSPRLPASKALVLSCFSDSSASLCTRTAVVVAFAAALRAGESCSPSVWGAASSFTLARADVSFTSDGDAAIHVRHSKGDKRNAGVVIPLLARSDALCPVAALRAYLASAPFRQSSSPLFMHSSGAALVRADVAALLKAHAPRCGLPAASMDTHSLRIGHVTALATANVPPLTIQAVARWSAASAPAMSLLYARISRPRLEVASAALAYNPGDVEHVPLTVSHSFSGHVPVPTARLLPLPSALISHRAQRPAHHSHV